MATKPKKKPNPFCGAQCSVCDKFRVCFGDAKHGGIRYCRECITKTLGWVQMTEAQRALVMAIFDKYEADPKLIVLLRMMDQAPPEFLKAMALGEATKRAFDAEREMGSVM